MKSFLPVFIAVLLMLGALPGKILPAFDHAHHAAAEAGHANGADHPHGVMPGAHCGVSISCAPLFVAADDARLANELNKPLLPVPADAGSLRGYDPDRDPPVPRVQVPFF